MRYESYIVAAYAVFFIVLAWDALAPQWQLRRVLRSVRLAARRQALQLDRDHQRGKDHDRHLPRPARRGKPIRLGRPRSPALRKPPLPREPGLSARPPSWY